ncbi:hypothetical protein O9K51_09777 [Purpureocillium lavendulum]|uniref:Nucleoside phosphorylase domain-containing protein n=1 Tax=Purpureocillium lavendulum TaxID=1247861 RepID=A0AB34FFY2_9HYPO|nr:hypothetical protein O9K51_09777 [Purpureocillium lavendulum]
MADHEARPIGHPSATSEPCTEDYTTGWICALQEEYEAACRMLDVEYDGPETTNEHDNNTYVFGRISKHNVIIGCLPGGRYGTNSAATVARDMVRSFPHLKFALMVGIGGGAPTPDRDIRLGDVVVSEPHGKLGGVLQYDFGKRLPGALFQQTGQLNSPPAVLLGALPEMRRRHNDPRKADKILEHLKLMDDMPDYQRPADDRLYRANYEHTGGPTCAACGTDELEERAPRTDLRAFYVHYGTIASANSVMKNAKERDQLSRDPELNVLCFEMEAAGLMNNFPCLVIRGICDYSDSHKNDEWHKYAALAAAAYARELLHVLKPAKVVTLPPWADRLLQEMSATSRKADRIIQYHHTQEQREILDWLTPVDYGLQQSDYLARRQPGTGQWLLESNEFQGWLAATGQTLFCPGIPGAGKTILTSVVIDDLESRFRSEPNSGLAYIYCNFQRQEEQSLDHLLASIVKQLAERQPSVLSNIKAVYERHELSRTKPSLEDITRLLHSVAAVYSRIFIVVDALDECQASGRCRLRFLSELSELQKRHDSNIFATSRFIPEIVGHFKIGVSREIRASANDVATYLQSHIQGLPSVVQQSRELQEDIATGILQAVDGMFLLAPVYLNSLHDCMTRNEILRTVELFPKQEQRQNERQKVEVLSHAYDEAMRRIQGQRPRLKELAMQVLSWITFAKRQLTTSELQHALGTKPGTSELDYGDLPHIEDMVSVCAGMVTVDGKSGIIRLVHYTAQEYIMRRHKLWFPGTDSAIATICVTYLSFTVFEAGYCTTHLEFKERLRAYSFYSYASHNWGHHYPKDVQPSQAVVSFLDNEAKVKASSQALIAAKKYSSIRPWGPETRRDMTGLHLAAYFGMCKAAETLLQLGYSPGLKDNHLYTPLWYAALAGHKSAVKLLLEAGADANVAAPRFCGLTALQVAAKEGRLDVLKELLAAGADVNASAAKLAGRTAVQAAAESGHLEVVNELLSAGADVNAAAVNVKGRTALQAAAEGGHLDVIEKLLTAGADINAAGGPKIGRTALQAAAEGGRLEVVNKLLSAGADVNAIAVNVDGRTALQAAAEGGHLDVIEKLLTAGADINAAAGPQCGRTALQAASGRGQLAVVETLLVAGADVHAAAGSQDGRTALQAAAGQGNLDVVEKLLAAGADVNAAAAGYCGRAALQAAAGGGHPDVVEKLLVAGADVNAAAADHFGRTALQAAAEGGHLAVVEKLLAAGADVEAPKGKVGGTTALEAAAKCRHQKLLDLLSAKDA